MNMNKLNKKIQIEELAKEGLISTLSSIPCYHYKSMDSSAKFLTPSLCYIKKMPKAIEDISRNFVYQFCYTLIHEHFHELTASKSNYSYFHFNHDALASILCCSSSMVLPDEPKFDYLEKSIDILRKLKLLFESAERTYEAVALGHQVLWPETIIEMMHYFLASLQWELQKRSLFSPHIYTELRQFTEIAKYSLLQSFINTQNSDAKGVSEIDNIIYKLLKQSNHRVSSAYHIGDKHSDGLRFALALYKSVNGDYQKWIKCFDKATAITLPFDLFHVNISEIEQLIKEKPELYSCDHRLKMLIEEPDRELEIPNMEREITQYQEKKFRSEPLKKRNFKVQSSNSFTDNLPKILRNFWQKEHSPILSALKYFSWRSMVPGSTSRSWRSMYPRSTYHNEGLKYAPETPALVYGSTPTGGIIHVTAPLEVNDALKHTASLLELLKKREQILLKNNVITLPPSVLQVIKEILSKPGLLRISYLSPMSN